MEGGDVALVSDLVDEDGGFVVTPATVDRLELSVVMPCLNEAETLEVCIRKAQGFMDIHRVSGEIVVVDNGSTDGSQALAQRSGARVVEVLEKGYGAALIGGIAAAEGTYVIMGDADDSYDFSNLGGYLERLRGGDDLVMGNRFAGEYVRGAMPALHRYVGNPVLSSIGRLFFKTPVRDFHCGLRGFRRESIERLDLQTSGMEFASEMVVKSTLQGLRISEVPITLYPDGRTRAPHLRTWRDGWRHLRFLLLFSPRWLFLYPGLVLVLTGLCASAWLLPAPRAVGSVTFDTGTLLYAALAIIVGIQAVSFAILTGYFAESIGLSPVRAGFTRFANRITLERALVVSGVCIVLGLIVSTAAIELWSVSSFGVLDPAQSLRRVIPGVALVAIGSQIGLAGFVLEILRLKSRPPRMSAS